MTSRRWFFVRALLFVVAFLFYNDGVQTVIKITPVYASETLDLSTTTIAAVSSPPGPGLRGVIRVSGPAAAALVTAAARHMPRFGPFLPGWPA